MRAAVMRSHGRVDGRLRKMVVRYFARSILHHCCDPLQSWASVYNATYVLVRRAIAASQLRANKQESSPAVEISCQKNSSRVLYRVWYPHLPIIIFIYPVPTQGKGLSVRMPPNHYIQQKARNAVTHAHYSATHPFSTGTNAEKNQIASSQELPPAPRSLHQSVHDHPEKTQLGAAESGSGTADLWF
jgi:hypothetical protein